MKVLFICVCILFAAACSPAAQQGGYASLPAGDAASGAKLFAQNMNGAPACTTCHTIDGTALVGPSMQGYATRAQEHANDAKAASVGDYTYTSITQPSAYIVSGFGNSMYNQYARQLSSQEIADLIAYVLTL